MSVQELVTSDPNSNDIELPEANVVPPSSFNWNIFRYVADFTHLFGICVLIYILSSKKSVSGLSWKTQVLYLLVYISRYLDLFDHYQTPYLVVFKITYIGTSAGILLAFNKLAKLNVGSYEEDKDTVSMTCICIPCFLAACILTKSKEFLEIFWTFSEYLEGFAMIPQYCFCYREGGKTQQELVLLFIMAFGTYRVFYAFNWVYKLARVSGYFDPQSWLGGLFEIAFFVDFLSYQFKGRSVLRDAVIKVDDSLNATVEKMELAVLPSREKQIQQKKSELSDMRQRRVLGSNYEMVKMQEQL